MIWAHMTPNGTGSCVFADDETAERSCKANSGDVICLSLKY